MWSELRYLDIEGHRLAFREVGSGPILIVLNLYRRRAALVDPKSLADRFRLIQVMPIGFGYSDRVPGYAGERLAHQLHVVVDECDDDQNFVVWGYSAGGAMALSVAKQSQRCAGAICGGLAPIGFPTPGAMRQMDRRLAPDAPPRSLWWWFTTIDWTDELARSTAPVLFYWGGTDRQMAKRLQRMSEILSFARLDFVELPGHDHAGANQPATVDREVTPAVERWLSERLGSRW
jgi:pimeloyl-ACP methyl ester carboxylesterase